MIYILERNQHKRMANFRMISLQINNSNSGDVRKYIEKRYERWLEFSKFECTKAGMQDESGDVLNDVIIQLSKKDEDYLTRLCRTPSKCGKYKEIDILVLRMVKLNIFSPLSPYQWKCRPKCFKKVDENINLSKLNIIDEYPDEVDTPALTLKQFRLIRWIFYGLELTELERAVLEYRFIQGLPFSEWPGPEKSKRLYAIYNSVINTIHSILYKQSTE
jgi:hypothetical protein